MSLCIQTLDIVAENPDKFRIVALAAGSNVTLLADQVINSLVSSVILHFESSCVFKRHGRNHEPFFSKSFVGASKT